MHIYFLLIRLAALLGNQKAKLLLNGQANTLRILRQAPPDMWKDGIWFHAASVGEFEQARPIIEVLNAPTAALKDRCAEGPTASERPKIILTFFSPSGYEMRKNYDKADGVFYLPFATRRNAKEFLDLVQPKMAIFVKYEFWPAYLKELNKRAIPTYIISAIFRQGQPFFKPWGKPYRNLLHCFTKLFVQDENSKQLLAQYNITNVEVTGDTRFDRVSAIAQVPKDIPFVDRFAERPPSAERPAAPVRYKILIAGSTWPEDEQLLARYIEERPDVKLVLVPHEIDEEHMHRIFEIFKGKFVRYTEATPMNISHTRVLVVNTIGLLSSIYRYADVAYIGGGFGAGIHNTIEAAVYGIPVLFGPKHEHFREAKGLIAAGAAYGIRNYEELRNRLDEAFDNQTSMGTKAKAYVASECGATQSVLQSLKLKVERS